MIIRCLKGVGTVGLEHVYVNVWKEFVTKDPDGHPSGN